MKINARLLVRLYPRAWRERYGEEFVALIEESGASVRLLQDIFTGAMRERMREVFVPADNPDWLIGVLGASALAVAVAALGQILAAVLFERFANLSEFQTSYSTRLPIIATPPAVLRSLPSFAFLPLIGLIRGFLAFNLSGSVGAQRFRVRPTELSLWVAAFLLSATVQQFRAMVSNGFPGSPFYTPYQMWETAALSLGAPMLLLTAATRHDRLLRQKSRPSPPANVLGLHS